MQQRSIRLGEQRDDDQEGYRGEVLEQQDRQLPRQRVHFIGKIPRQQLFHYYSGADIFAFPGIEESLGMVYLEAQSCGLPVVACADWGGGEAVLHKQTGLLSRGTSASEFTANIRKLAEDDQLRHSLAAAARAHITEHHDLKKNYTGLEHKLSSLCRCRLPGAAG